MTEHASSTPHPDRAAGRTVAITGAGGNVGPTVARAFADAGWRLALFDTGRSVDELREAFPNAAIVTADLTDVHETERAVAKAKDSLGAFDAAIHLAGGFATAAAGESDDALFTKMMDLNFRTLRTFVAAVLPDMLERGSGAIAGVGARQALQGGGKATAYAAAKGAVLGYLRALRTEVGPSGIGVAAIVPMGTIDTEQNRDAMPKADPAGWISPDALADALLFFVERGAKGRVGEIRLEAVKVAERS